jgi:hypothetical protein
MGAFLYCFAGGSVQAAFIIGNVAQLAGLSCAWLVDRDVRDEVY